MYDDFYPRFMIRASMRTSKQSLDLIAYHGFCQPSLHFLHMVMNLKLILNKEIPFEQG